MVSFKKSLLLLLSIALGGMASAQSHGKTIEELWATYRAADGDSARVAALASVASGYLPINRDSSVLLVELALEKSRALKIRTVEGNALVSLAEAFDVGGDIDNALKNFDLAQKIFTSLNNLKGLARVHNSRGLAYYYVSRVDEAIKDWETARNISSKDGDLVQLSKVQHNLGMAYSAKNEIKNALNYYLLARNLKDSLVNLNIEGITARDQVSTYTMLGNFYMDLFQIEQARESMKMAIELTPDNELFRKMVTLFNLGTLEELDSNYAEAQTLYEKSLELAIQGNFLPNQISIYTGLGQVAGFLNADERAATYFNQAKLILVDYPNPRSETNLLANEGMFFLQKKEYDKAKQNALRALEIAQVIQSDRHRLYAYKILSLATEALQEWPAAAQYARQYINLKEQLDGAKRKQEVVGLQAAMDVERASVRYEQKLKDQELEISQQWIKWLTGALILALIFALGLAYNYYRVQITNKALTVARADLQEGNFRLVKTNQLLQMANTKIQQFAFATGHDLKESLRNITSFTQLAAIEMLENVSAAQGHLKEATTSGKRMRKMLDDLLHFSNISGNDATVDTIPVQEVVSSVKQQLKAEILEAQGDVHITTAAVVKANRSEVEQVFYNLIHNALRYRLPDTPARVTIKMDRRPDGEAVFLVADNGMGIPEQERKNIFKPFHRLHNRAQSGSGLGLAICQEIVTNYGGEIWCEPGTNGGSLFCFTLPKAEPKG